MSDPKPPAPGETCPMCGQIPHPGGKCPLSMTGDEYLRYRRGFPEIVDALREEIPLPPASPEPGRMTSKYDHLPPFIKAGVLANLKHGYAGDRKTPTYQSWVSMLNRCRNPKVKSYPRYGGRGISVCERWHNFQLFLLDMGEVPLGYSIERKDNDGDYEPGNCLWIPKEKQIALEENGIHTRPRCAVQLKEDGTYRIHQTATTPTTGRTS